MTSNTSNSIPAGLALALALTGCGSPDPDPDSTAQLTGQVGIDGSSTVYPITEAVAEEFRLVHPRVEVEVGVSGTGGGFKKFCAGTTVINDASRPIKSSEIRRAADNRIGFIELPVAYDGLTVVVHKANTFVDYLSIVELRKIWEPGSQVRNWNQVRASFPNLAMKLYGPGTDSGTFDYFTKVVNGKEQACRADFTTSEDDNVLVKGVAGDRGALGFFGYAYFAENQQVLRAVPIANGGGEPVTPSLETINNGTYSPLSRPIFIYVAESAAGREAVNTFVEFYLSHAPELVEKVGYVKLPAAIYQAARQRFARRVTGTVFGDPAAKHKALLDLFQ